MANKKIFLILIGIILFSALALKIFFLPKKANAPVSGPKLPSKNSGVEKQKCGIENCHGLDITCGPNIPEMCTEMYQMGDFCRSYAKCEVKDSKCQLIKNADFDQCKNCMEKCIKDARNNSAKSFNCESQCNLRINETEKPELM